MRLSILVVSRTPELLNSMLSSLQAATNLDAGDVEILCSWNGTHEAEAAISNASGYDFLIAQRTPYHFAGNMNGLAERANGEVLLLINDDVVLDPGSLDAGLHCLKDNAQVGLVGSRLRNQEGQLIHAGILFDSRHSPYHQLDRLTGSEHAAALGENRPMPAVTGALVLIGREHFQALRFNTDYIVCGEDVELCLDVRERLGLEVWYCPRFSGVHESESTRRQEPNQGGNSEDLSRMRARHRAFLDSASRPQLRQDLQASIAEAEALRSFEAHRHQEGASISATLANLQRLEQHFNDQQALAAEQLANDPLLQQEIKHWQLQAHSLQLERLKLQQQLQQQGARQ